MTTEERKATGRRNNEEGPEPGAIEVGTRRTRRRVEGDDGSACGYHSGRAESRLKVNRDGGKSQKHKQVGPEKWEGRSACEKCARSEQTGRAPLVPRRHRCAHRLHRELALHLGRSLDEVLRDERTLFRRVSRAGPLSRG